jgi:hypothetical protein
MHDGTRLSSPAALPTAIQLWFMRHLLSILKASHHAGYRKTLRAPARPRSLLDLNNSSGTIAAACFSNGGPLPGTLRPRTMNGTSFADANRGRHVLSRRSLFRKGILALGGATIIPSSKALSHPLGPDAAPEKQGQVPLRIIVVESSAEADQVLDSELL